MSYVCWQLPNLNIQAHLLPWTLSTECLWVEIYDYIERMQRVWILQITKFKPIFSHYYGYSTEMRTEWKGKVEALKLSLGSASREEENKERLTAHPQCKGKELSHSLPDPGKEYTQWAISKSRIICSNKTKILSVKNYHSQDAWVVQSIKHRLLVSA